MSDGEPILGSGAGLDHGVLVCLEANGHMAGDVEPLLQDMSARGTLKHYLKQIKQSRTINPHVKCFSHSTT